jgi:predicted dinucleotide-binding enzyme
MQIGILGAGNIGGALSQKLAAAGHAVMLGVRDPDSPKARAARSPGVEFGTLAAAAAFGDVVVVALPLDAARAALPELDLAGKTLIDTTNSFGGLPEGFPSAGAAIAAAAPGAQVAKAWNATPWEAIVDPVYGGQPIETFVCGDSPAAKATAIQLVRDTGFIPVDIGGLANAPLSENFARLWGTLAYQAGYGRGVAFKLVAR